MQFYNIPIGTILECIIAVRQHILQQPYSMWELLTTHTMDDIQQLLTEYIEDSQLQDSKLHTEMYAILQLYGVVEQ